MFLRKISIDLMDLNRQRTPLVHAGQELKCPMSVHLDKYHATTGVTAEPPQLVFYVSTSSDERSILKLTLNTISSFLASPVLVNNFVWPLISLLGCQQNPDFFLKFIFSWRLVSFHCTNVLKKGTFLAYIMNTAYLNRSNIGDFSRDVGLKQILQFYAVA